LEEMLESHEFRRVVFGDVERFFGMLPFSVTVFSDEPLLVKLGRLEIVFGGEGVCSAVCPLPLWVDLNSLSGEVVGT
jgi:hypothetical protein